MKGAIMSSSIEDEKKKINQKINAGDYKGADSAITALLKNSANQDLRFLKARVYMLRNRPEYNKANDERKTKIREESIKLANEIVGRSNNAYGYKLKGDVLAELDPENEIILKEQCKAYHAALKFDQHNQYSADLRLLINNIKRKVPGIDCDEPDLDQRTPIASFNVSISSGKAPLVVQFTDTSQHSPTSWVWKFGDGTESSLQHPGHTYQNVGTYTVSLIVTNVKGSHQCTLPACVVVTDIVKPPEEEMDPDKVYEKSLVALVKDHPVIIDMILLENEQKLQIKGFLYDAFEGTTPKEFNILLHCIEEMVPFTICKFHNEEVMLKIRLQIREKALIDRAYSEKFVEWGITTWKKALSPMLMERDPAKNAESGERGYSM